MVNCTSYHAGLVLKSAAKKGNTKTVTNKVILRGRKAIWLIQMIHDAHYFYTVSEKIG